LQILLHAQIEDELGNFSIEQVITTLSQKLMRRHPHVFGSDEETEQKLNTEQVLNQWEVIKKTERSEAGNADSILDGVPASLPALLRAYQVQKRAARVGFDWNKPEQVVEKLDEEIQELRETTNHHEKSLPPKKQNNTSLNAIEHEFGDVLFTIANLARFLNVNPEEALRKSCNRFIHRFVNMEQQATANGKDLQQLTPKEWNIFWENAKRQEEATDKLRPSL
jgi:tetrapyrrole methylase family protein/MazG family protein